MLLKFIKVEIGRQFVRWQTLLALILMFALFIQGFEAFRPNGIALSSDKHNYFLAFLYAQGKGPRAMLPIIVALVVSLVAGDSLALDRKTGYVQFSLLRITYPKYILGKIISASIISFVFVFIAEAVAFIYGVLTFPAPAVMEYNRGIYPEYASQLFIDHPYLYVLLIIFNTSLMAMVIALLSVFVSTKVKNVLVVIAVPFTLSILLQFAFNALNLNRYAPLDLVGTYMLSYYKYQTLEIPGIHITLWMILCFITYGVYTRKFHLEAK